MSTLFRFKPQFSLEIPVENHFVWFLIYRNLPLCVVSTLQKPTIMCGFYFIETDHFVLFLLYRNLPLCVVSTLQKPTIMRGFYFIETDHYVCLFVFNLCEETISRTDEGQPRPKYIFNKCGTNIYFFTLQRFGPSPSPNFKCGFYFIETDNYVWFLLYRNLSL